MRIIVLFSSGANPEEVFDVYENALEQAAAPNDDIASGSAVDSSIVIAIDLVASCFLNPIKQ